MICCLRFATKRNDVVTACPFSFFNIRAERCRDY